MSSPDALGMFKRLAKMTSRRTGVQHMVALEACAKHFNFLNYHEASKVLARNDTTDHRTQLVVAAYQKAKQDGLFVKARHTKEQQQ